MSYMPPLSAVYNPAEVEEKRYAEWMDKKLFRSIPDHRKAYTIVIPPPNVTGILHMGHILNNTIQDVLIRRARMQGYNACWVPGTDHASIATEAKVVAMLKEKGINKWNITREEFLTHAFAWKDKYGGTILQQLRKLGCSCDWERTRFTMEEKLSAAVTKTFVDLYRKGLVYKGWRMTNWDPSAKTAVSDEEVYHKDTVSKLYYVRYAVSGEPNEWVTIATTRPETILADTAVCCNPNDERYTHLQGKKIIIPIVNREVDVIFDEYIDPAFGTGAMKVTPAHDINDYELGKRHHLPFIDIMTEEGKLNEKALFFVGEDRFAARKKMIQVLEEGGYLVKIEENPNKVGYSERTHVVIEPRLTEQWFVKMDALAKPALEAVLQQKIHFFPENYVNIYRHWMENVRDWCISRQLWWGQRIPAYYLPDGSYIVAETASEALQLAQAQSGNDRLTLSDLKQDEDVVDTWFSSWLWPISVFDGFENDTELNYYYPTQVLVTAADIIFFWVARMIMAGCEWRNEIPFHDVYFTGIVRDKQGRKMSKSLGNSPDPIELMNTYGADGVRVGMLLSAPAGGDLLFDEKLCEQGRNFCNKIWNALRLVTGWEVAAGERNEHNQAAIDWFDSKLKKTADEVEHLFGQYRISEVLKTLYSFFWDDFCADYLEMVKPEFGKPIDEATYEATVHFFEQLLCFIHPIMPFISEEAYQLLRPRAAADSICIAAYPKAGQAYSEAAIRQGDSAVSIISLLRDVRQKHKMSPKEPLKAYLKAAQASDYQNFMPIVKKRGNLEVFELTDRELQGAAMFVVNKDELYVQIAAEKVDAAAEKARIAEELAYYEGFKEQIMKKLGNAQFVDNAPAQVVEKERQKLADAEDKIKILSENLAKL